MKKQLPNATTVLVLGISSIVTSCIFIGILFAIVALILSKNDERMYQISPNNWMGYGNLTAGKTCSIIGICLGILFSLVSSLLSFVVGHLFKMFAEAFGR